MADSVATSHDKHQRPTKKRALSPTSKQAASVEALFANPTAAMKEPSAAKERGPAPPPEIVTNVQGSSAGAGSGEFHVYKASRRREYERLRAMEEETAREEGDAKYEAEMEAARRKDEEKTGKNRARRERARARKDKKGGGALAGVAGAGKEGDNALVAKVKLKANGVPPPNGGMKGTAEDLEMEPKVVEEAGIVIHDDD